MNQYYNKQIAKKQIILAKTNGLKWSKELQRITDKRRNKINYFIHCSTRHIVNWCLENQIDTIVIGLNKEWKQNINIGSSTQHFVYLPYELFIKTLTYKCEDVRIKVIQTEESYTSGTSVLDYEQPIKKNYNKERRFVRGLFLSNEYKVINSDVNGAYQIIKKVFPNEFSDGIEGVHLHPLIINV
jgi:putative transposase